MIRVGAQPKRVRTVAAIRRMPVGFEPARAHGVSFVLAETSPNERNVFGPNEEIGSEPDGNRPGMPESFPRNQVEASAVCGSIARENAVAFDTQPNIISVSSRVASWFVRTVSEPIGSAVQSSSKTHR